MSNTLTAVTPKLLAQGLLALRENCVMPRLVNSQYSEMAGQRGSTIDVPIPSSISVQDVTPDRIAPVTADFSPTSVSLAMDQWKEVSFYMTDQDILTAMNGTIPMQASEAIKSLSNHVDAYILGLYKKVYGFAGAAGVTPFGTSTTEATEARKILNNQLAPLMDRRFVFDADAEANALNLRAFQDASWTGDSRAINEGSIIRKLGFDWFLDQNVQTHTRGTLPAAGAISVNGAHLAGVTTVSIAGAGAGTMVAGDVFTIAGDSQTYTVLTTATWGGAGNQNVSISPALQEATAGGEGVTLKNTHVVNLAFHRDAFAFANRPLADNTDGLGNIIQSAVDPVSGLSLRLEVSREHKRTRFSYDILFGAVLIRPELACRVAG